MLAVSKNFSFLNFSSLSAMGLLLAAVPLILRPAVAHADGVQTYGTEDALGTGAYGTDDPTAGATKIGLAPNVSSLATKSYAHTFPFTPSPGDFPGTDQIYVGSVQTASDDGYSSSPDRISGPDVITMDYSSLVPADSTIQTVTLGIAADNFEFPVFGQPFNITLNGASASGVNQFAGVARPIRANSAIRHAWHLALDLGPFKCFDPLHRRRRQRWRWLGRRFHDRGRDDHRRPGTGHAFPRIARRPGSPGATEGTN